MVLGIEAHRFGDNKFDTTGEPVSLHERRKRSQASKEEALGTTIIEFAEERT